MCALTDIFKQVVMKDLKGDQQLQKSRRRSRKDCKNLDESHSMRSARANSYSMEDTKFKPNT